MLGGEVFRGYREQEEAIQAISLEEVVHSVKSSRSLWMSWGGWDVPVEDGKA